MVSPWKRPGRSSVSLEKGYSLSVSAWGKVYFRKLLRLEASLNLLNSRTKRSVFISTCVANSPSASQRRQPDCLLLSKQFRLFERTSRAWRQHQAKLSPTARGSASLSARDLGFCRNYVHYPPIENNSTTLRFSHQDNLCGFIPCGFWGVVGVS